MTDPLPAHDFAPNVPVLCWLANPDGDVHWYNQAWYDYTGQTAAEAEGWGWRDVYDPEILPEVLVRWTSHLASKRPFQMVAPLRGADRIFRPFLMRVRPALRAGEVLSWFGSSTDVSDLIADDPGLRAELASLRSPKVRPE